MVPSPSDRLGLLAQQPRQLARGACRVLFTLENRAAGLGRGSASERQRQPASAPARALSSRPSSASASERIGTFFAAMIPLSDG